MLTEDNQVIGDKFQYVIEKISRFIMAYGPEIHQGSLSELMNEIRWFSRRNRLFTYTYKGELIAVSAGIRVSKAGVDRIFDKDWPTESSNGGYFYVRFVVIRDEYKDYNISRAMIHLIQSMFPGLKYIVYNSRKGKWHTRRIESFGGMNHGKR